MKLVGTSFCRRGRREGEAGEGPACAPKVANSRLFARKLPNRRDSCNLLYVLLDRRWIPTSCVCFMFFNSSRTASSILSAPILMPSGAGRTDTSGCSDERELQEREPCGGAQERVRRKCAGDTANGEGAAAQPDSFKYGKVYVQLCVHRHRHDSCRFPFLRLFPVLGLAHPAWEGPTPHLVDGRVI